MGTDSLKLRRRVNSWNQIRRYVEKYNGLAHIYVSVYSLDFTLDKIVFDIDSQSFELALTVASELANTLQREKVGVVPVFSGKKGFHIYALFKPWKAPDHATADIVVKSVSSYFLSTLDSDLRKHVDTHVLNARALIRLPGTLHPETLKYCTPVSLCEINSREDIMEYANTIHDLSDISCLVSLPDIRKYVDLNRAHEVELKSPPEFGLRVKWEGSIADIDKFLLGMVRPCVVYYSHNPEADHFIRTALATELAWLDFSPEEMVKIFAKLEWSDYNYYVSLYHARKVWEKVRARMLFPPSCYTLRERGYCLGKSCPYYPSCFYWWGTV